MVPVFDGHNDLLTQLHGAGAAAAEQFAAGLPGHIDAVKAKTGGFRGGLFAVWIPSPLDADDLFEKMKQMRYDLPLPAEVSQGEALVVAREQVALLRRLEELGALTVCEDVAAIERTMAEDRIAAVLHFEGAEAIDPDFQVLEEMHRAGLRSLGPVWSRPTRYGHGVPFRFPSWPDIGDGLTPDGERLVKRCNELKIMVDLSHINEAGFWDVARISDAPLVATHSNAHALCPHARNLTDKQLDAIAESDGMVGLNFAVAFLRGDGGMHADTPVSDMIGHLDHLIARLGEDRVGLGSDFDGAVVPEEIGSSAGLPTLVEAMREAGYGEALIEKICWRNWLRALDKSWT